MAVVRLRIMLIAFCCTLLPAQAARTLTAVSAASPKAKAAPGSRAGRAASRRKGLPSRQASAGASEDGKALASIVEDVEENAHSVDSDDKQQLVESNLDVSLDNESQLVRQSSDEKKDETLVRQLSTSSSSSRKSWADIMDDEDAEEEWERQMIGNVFDDNDSENADVNHDSENDNVKAMRSAMKRAEYAAEEASAQGPTRQNLRPGVPYDAARQRALAHARENAASLKASRPSLKRVLTPSSDASLTSTDVTERAMLALQGARIRAQAEVKDRLQQNIDAAKRRKEEQDAEQDSWQNAWQDAWQDAGYITPVHMDSSGSQFAWQQDAWQAGSTQELTKEVNDSSMAANPGPRSRLKPAGIAKLRDVLLQAQQQRTEDEQAQQARRASEREAAASEAIDELIEKVDADVYAAGSEATDALIEKVDADVHAVGSEASLERADTDDRQVESQRDESPVTSAEAKVEDALSTEESERGIVDEDLREEQRRPAASQAMEAKAMQAPGAEEENLRQRLPELRRRMQESEEEAAAQEEKVAQRMEEIQKQTRQARANAQDLKRSLEADTEAAKKRTEAVEKESAQRILQLKFAEAVSKERAMNFKRFNELDEEDSRIRGLEVLAEDRTRFQESRQAASKRSEDGIARALRRQLEVESQANEEEQAIRERFSELKSRIQNEEVSLSKRAGRAQALSDEKIADIMGRHDKSQMRMREAAAEFQSRMEQDEELASKRAEEALAKSQAVEERTAQRIAQSEQQLERAELLAKEKAEAFKRHMMQGEEAVRKRAEEALEKARSVEEESTQRIAQSIRERDNSELLAREAAAEFRRRMEQDEQDAQVRAGEALAASKAAEEAANHKMAVLDWQLKLLRHRVAELTRGTEEPQENDTQPMHFTIFSDGEEEEENPMAASAPLVPRPSVARRTFTAVRGEATQAGTDEATLGAVRRAEQLIEARLLAASRQHARPTTKVLAPDAMAATAAESSTRKLRDQAAPPAADLRKGAATQHQPEEVATTPAATATSLASDTGAWEAEPKDSGGASSSNYGSGLALGAATTDAMIRAHPPLDAATEEQKANLAWRKGRFTQPQVQMKLAHELENDIHTSTRSIPDEKWNVRHAHELTPEWSHSTLATWESPRDDESEQMLQVHQDPEAQRQMMRHLVEHAEKCREELQEVANSLWLTIKYHTSLTGTDWVRFPLLNGDGYIFHNMATGESQASHRGSWLDAEGVPSFPAYRHAQEQLIYANVMANELSLAERAAWLSNPQMLSSLAPGDSLS